MPSLPSTSKTRRKRITPIANLHEEDVWARTFKLLGLEPLTPFSGRNCAPNTIMQAVVMSGANGLEGVVNGDGAHAGKKAKSIGFTFEDMPSEVQKEVFSQVSTSDLIALSLVSKHFRDLAAEQLYRHFHIVFPDEDDPSYESPIDGLAGGLDTFVTSEYDYSRYLKEVMLDTLSGGEKGERAYKHYTYDVSCGKFMNTLFLLTMRKAKQLENFRWDLRVEISRPLFKALHAIPTLKSVHIRLQEGHSMYEQAPPLPSLATQIPDEAFADISLFKPAPSPVTGTSINVWGTAKQASKVKTKGLPGDSKFDSAPPHEPPTISGFKNLKSLAVLDMDNLDYLAEIKTAVRNSSSTLQKLKLSFSEKYAISSRKPVAPAVLEHPDESEEEIDEFGDPIPLPPQPMAAMSSSDDAVSKASKTLRASEVRKSQEAVLGRIFGVEPATSKKAKGSDDSSTEEEKKLKKQLRKAAEDADPRKVWENELKIALKKMMKAMGGTGPQSTVYKDALELLGQASKKYIDSSEKIPTPVEGEKSEDAVLENASASASSATNKEFQTNGTFPEHAALDSVDEPVSGMFDSPKKDAAKTTTSKSGPSPDDIDLDEPEPEVDPPIFEEIAVEDVQSQEKPEETDENNGEPKTQINGFPEVVTREPKTGVITFPAAQQLMSEASINRLQELKEMKRNSEKLRAKMDRCQDTASKLGQQIVRYSDNPKVISQLTLDLMRKNAKDLKTTMDGTIEELAQINADVEDIQKQITEKQSGTAEMIDYIRSTRGIPLKSFSLYLIPLKVSVLTEAIDFTVLERLTLLNVGPQDRLWTSLMKLNESSPLPLVKIFSDNVTTTLLNFVGGLAKVEELFLMEGREQPDPHERRPVEKLKRRRAASTASKTNVTIEQIRRMALKKHIGTLKRLVINNFDGAAWDANDQTIKLICRKGLKLEELALAMGVRATHTFNQYLPHLTNLRAMHILFFRNEDHCVWVVREIRKFAVDCVASNPDMKLEYIALGSSVERIVKRTKRGPRQKPDIKGKGKDISGFTGWGGTHWQTSDSSWGSSGHGVNDGGSGGTMTSISNLVNLDKLMGKGLAEEEESSESEGEDLGPGMKLETLEGVRFYDIYGIRIFQKDILGGWL